MIPITSIIYCSFDKKIIVFFSGHPYWFWPIPLSPLTMPIPCHGPTNKSTIFANFIKFFHALCVFFFIWFFCPFFFFFFFIFNKKKKKINNFLKAPHHYKIAQTKIEKHFFILKLYFKILYPCLLNNITNIFYKINIYNFSSSVIYLTNKHLYFYIKQSFFN